MKALLKHPGQEAKVINLYGVTDAVINTLLDTDNAKIFGINSLRLLVDDNAYRKYLPFNMFLRGYKICGPILIIKTTGEGFSGLSDEELLEAKDLLASGSEQEFASW